MSSIYVSGDGQWKLGGLQYLCTFTDLNHSYLKHARIHRYENNVQLILFYWFIFNKLFFNRYDKAVDPDEESQELISKVDQYAYAVLVFDAFKGRNDGNYLYFLRLHNILL